jgi:peroxiredoxin Q/BCP
MRTLGPAILVLAIIAAGCGTTHDSAKMERAAAESSPMVGREAPAFTLPDETGQSVALQDLRGQWVVLYFYPKDDTPGCICQATEFTELLFQFRQLNARVLGISEDSPASHRSFIEKHGLELTLLSDPDHDVMRRYGAWVPLPDAGGRTVRSTYLIGPAGRIRYHWPEVIPQGHARRVADKLRELQQNTSASSGLLPANRPDRPRQG